MADRYILGVRFTGLDRADDDLTGVDTDPNRQRRLAALAQLVRVTPELPLHAQGRMQRALRMVFAGDGRTEQREDAVAGGLGYVTVIVTDGVDHQLQRRIDDGTGL